MPYTLGDFHVVLFSFPGRYEECFKSAALFTRNDVKCELVIGNSCICYVSLY